MDITNFSCRYALGIPSNGWFDTVDLSQTLQVYMLRVVWRLTNVMTADIWDDKLRLFTLDLTNSVKHISILTMAQCRHRGWEFGGNSYESCFFVHQKKLVRTYLNNRIIQELRHSICSRQTCMRENTWANNAIICIHRWLRWTGNNDSFIRRDFKIIKNKVCCSLCSFQYSHRLKRLNILPTLTLSD